MFGRYRLALGLFLSSLFGAPPLAVAAWPHDPANGNVVVAAAPGNQQAPVAVSDSAGGTIVAWFDYRNGAAADIYVQRLNAAGAPMWLANGVALCTAGSEQTFPRITADGAGGAVVTWTDYRNGANYDIYAQRINAAGVVQWANNGVGLCIAPGFQLSPAIAPDGTGGAIVTWQDQRNGTYDIYTQRVNGSGAVQWTPNGFALCSASGNQLTPTIISDGSGGAVASWHDLRSGAYDVYAQRVNAFGLTSWQSNGVPVCTAFDDQYSPVLVADGAGGSIIAWYDQRSSQYDIYAQRLSPSGAPLWNVNGVALCAAAGDQYLPSISTDRAGGAVVAWYDFRGGSSSDIYVQRISALGVPLWTAEGQAVCTAALNQYVPVVVPDDAGGAEIAWYDERGGAFDVYAQRVSAAGTVVWPANGVAVSLAADNQTDITIVPNGSGGAIMAWQDQRAGTNTDVYAQRIDRYGYIGNVEPKITSTQDVPGDQGGSLRLRWAPSYIDAAPTFGVTEYRVYRAAPGASWEYLGSHVANGAVEYSRVITTVNDSTPTSNPRTRFMVEARQGVAPTQASWPSAPDSGYSVDNLSPESPTGFAGEWNAGVTRMRWRPNTTDADFVGYRLYRSDRYGFVPDSTNFVVALTDTEYVDTSVMPLLYKVRAVDVHGNESVPAILVPDGTAAVSDGPPAWLSFAAPRPNPARGGTRLRYTLSRAGHVRLAVYDAAGRRVLLVREGELGAGSHEETVVLRSESGRALPSGLYLVRLDAEGRELSQRLVNVQ